MATPTTAILKAIEAIVEQAQNLHPEIPDVVIVLGASGRTRKGAKHGHFAPDSWDTSKGAPSGEVLLAGESLARGAVATLGTILHELAHATAHVQGIRDTSNNGRYHNGKFKAIAEEFGIVVEVPELDPTIGWSKTSVPEATVEQYASLVKALEVALTTYRVSVLEAPAKPKKSTVVKISCECDHPFNINRSWWDDNEGSLSCKDCFEDYKEVTE